MDMDERFYARTAIENAFCDASQKYPSGSPEANAGIARCKAVICGGLPWVGYKESKTGYPRNITVVFHWRDCETKVRGFTLEMYERGEKWLNALKGI